MLNILDRIEEVHLSGVSSGPLSIGMQILVRKEQCIIQNVSGAVFHVRVRNYWCISRLCCRPSE